MIIDWNHPNFQNITDLMDNVDFDDIHETQDRRAGRLDAEDVRNYLMEQVAQFQAALTDNEEIGLRLANFGEAAQIHIRDIGYKNPNIIEFYGLNPDDHKVTLIQHISQLNFLLIAVKPIEEKPFRIGFGR